VTSWREVLQSRKEGRQERLAAALERGEGSGVLEESVAPAIILVEPQLPENIGTAARAMMNCGLSDLRLVKPRPEWLSDRALAASSGADEILLSARVFDSTAEAVSGLHHVYATTGRTRSMVKPVVTPRFAARDIWTMLADDRKVGILFGKERTGLENDDLTYAQTQITVPLNPEHCSLNLAQAVLLIGYEWYQEGDETVAEQMPLNGTIPATMDEQVNFFLHLERELDDCGFLRNAEMRPNMVRNLRNLFLRAQLTEQEVRTLHGVVSELATARKQRAAGLIRRGEWPIDELIRLADENKDLPKGEQADKGTQAGKGLQE